MTKRAESTGLGARAELRAWYLGHLRPRLAEAAAARIVAPGAVEELDLQVAGLIELPGAFRHASSASMIGAIGVPVVDVTRQGRPTPG
jgi:hypothetical protein